MGCLLLLVLCDFLFDFCLISCVFLFINQLCFCFEGEAFFWEWL